MSATFYKGPLLFLTLVLSFCCFFTACYTFKDVGIPPDVKTYYVAPFEINAPDAPPTLPVTFADRLRDKIRIESRLQYVDTDPDVEFLGVINDYYVSAQAPEPGETTAFNRLEIKVAIDFINHKNEEKNWKKTFPYFVDFGSDENLLSIQDDLIDDINEQLVEDIFNAAFSDW